MCSAVASQSPGYVHTSTVTRKRTPSSQDRGVSCYLRLLNSFFSGGCPQYLYCGSSSACVEVRGLEKGRAASKFLGKSTSISEGSTSCSRAHWMLWEEFNGLLGTMAEGLHLSTESQNHRETINFCRAKEFFPDKLFSGKHLHKMERFSVTTGKPLCVCAFLFNQYKNATST